MHELSALQLLGAHALLASIWVVNLWLDNKRRILRIRRDEPELG